jgi:hypothetical protein
MEGERFAIPQAAVYEQREEWRVSAAFRGGQERAHLVGRHTQSPRLAATTIAALGYMLTMLPAPGQWVDF